MKVTMGAKKTVRNMKDRPSSALEEEEGDVANSISFCANSRPHMFC